MIDSRLLINEFEKFSKDEQRIFAMMLVGGVEALMEFRSAKETGIIPLELLYEVYSGALEEVKSGRFSIRDNIN